MFESIHFNSVGRKTTNASKPEVIAELRAIVGAENVVVDPDKRKKYGGDGVKEQFRRESVRVPDSTAQLVPIITHGDDHLVPVTASRGGA